MAKVLKLPYTNREFDSILAFISSQMSVELPESNDWLVSNVGRWILETFAAIADMTAFTIDRQAAECFLDTVETRENLVALLKILGFQPFNPVPESVTVTFQLTTPTTQISDVQVPNGTRLFSSKTSLPWITTAAAVIAAGSRTISTQARQGEFRSIEFVSSGNPFQQFLVNSQNVSEGDVAVTVDGNAWQPADGEAGRPDSLVGLGTGAEFFRVLKTQDMKIIVEFGDGIDGLIPPKGSQIIVQVFLTEHVNGKANSGDIDQIIDPLSVAASVTNPKASGGGVDFESIASARLRWPAVFASQNRAVTLTDYEAQARLVPGVLQARAVDHSMDDSVPFFEVDVYIIGNNGLPSESLNTDVTTLLDQVKMNPISVSVMSPGTVSTDVLITQLFVRRQFVKANVAAEVITAVQDFFTLTSDGSGAVNMGSNVAISQLSAAIQNVEGVSSFTWVIRKLSPEDTAIDTQAQPQVIVNNTPAIGSDGRPLTLPDGWTPGSIDTAFIVVAPTEYAYLNSVAFLQLIDPSNPHGPTQPNLITV